MPDCQYCDQEFDSEDDLNDHLASVHADELGPIDRRKLGLADDDDAGPNWGLVALVFLVAGILGVIVGTLWLGSGGGGDSPTGNATHQPTDLWGVHYHGTIEVVIDGKTIDFSQDRYQLQANAFHFENNRGNRWHGHARELTLKYAMATLGIDVSESSVTFNGETYRNSSAGTTVRITVNGEPVVPSEYFLSDGDHIRIVVETA